MQLLQRRKSLWQSTKKWIQLRSKTKSEELLPPLHVDVNHPDYDGKQDNYNVETQELRLFVGTWNVAGKPPTDEWVMQEWLGSQEQQADIYVIGFQEIVPLNAGNVLGNEDKGASARKWDDLIMRALNETSSLSFPYSCWSSDSELAHTRTNSSTNTPSSPSTSIDDTIFHTCAYYEDIMGSHASARKPLTYDKYSHSKGTILDGNIRRHSSAEESCGTNWESNSALESRTSSSILFSNIMPNIPSPGYHQIASKQMVGLFMSVWIRRDLYRYVKAVEVSTVGCGIMGRLGNKGAISVSLSLHETNFCFICSHLKSGDKPNDIILRNFDIDEILRRTRFQRSKKLAALNLPKTILAHDQIIWFGDLNYRVSLPCMELKLLVAKGDWENLLKQDQLKSVRGRGGVLEGWNEGPISFPPTYKYVPNSDVYILMQHPIPHNAAQKRAPAWCDRILWYGKGIKQLYYTSNNVMRQSDHRPVSASFIAEVETMLRRPLLTHDVFFNNSRQNLHADPSLFI